MLFFVRSGVIALKYGSLRDTAMNGDDWSRASVKYSSATNAKAHRLYFNEFDVNPSHGPYERSHGFPVRCLVYKLCFVRSGWFSLSVDTLRVFGYKSSIWSNSSTHQSAINSLAFLLYFDTSDIYPSRGPDDYW